MHVRQPFHFVAGNQKQRGDATHTPNVTFAPPGSVADLTGLAAGRSETRMELMTFPG